MKKAIFLLLLASLGSSSIKSGESLAISSAELGEIFDQVSEQSVHADIVNEISNFTGGAGLTITLASRKPINNVCWPQVSMDRIVNHLRAAMPGNATLIYDEHGTQKGTINGTEITLTDDSRPFSFDNMVYDAHMYQDKLYVLTPYDLHVVVFNCDNTWKSESHKIKNKGTSFPWEWKDYPTKIKDIHAIENKKGIELTKVTIDCFYPRSERVYQVEEHGPIAYEAIQRKFQQQQVQRKVQRKKSRLLCVWAVAVEVVLCKIFASWVGSWSS